MTSDQIKELKNRNKIFVVANRLGLFKRSISENYQSTYCVSCPNVSVHKNNDRSPSLALLPRINKFKCYTCGIEGDVIELVRKVRNCSFQEAILWLDPNAILSSVKNPKAKAYLNKKGLSVETIKKFSVFTGEYWHDGQKYECVYFPIKTGLKYRLIDCPDCKYKNGVNAFHCLFKTIEDSPYDLVVLCEGELDSMVGWQNTGYPFWSSTGGTNTFDPSWVNELKRFHQIIIGYDNDDAGKEGAQNTIKTLIDGGINRENIIQIEVPELLGKDWSDFFTAGMKKADFDELIEIELNKRGNHEFVR